MSEWVIDKEDVVPLKSSRMSSDWIIDEEHPDNESFIKSLAYAPFRTTSDLAKSAFHGVQKIPELYEKSKTEVPGLLDLIKNHKAHAATQAFAGGNEAINMLAQSPYNIASYIQDRLHLLPKGTAEFVGKHLVPEDTTEAINKLFDQPKYAGESLLRGTARNLPALIPAGRFASAAGRGINNLRPINAFRGNLTPDELLHNLRITQGTQTGLGDVVGSPFLKRVNENILTKIPFSGVTEAMQKNAGTIIEKGHSLVDQLAGNSNIENLDKHLNDALKSSFKSHQAQKNAHYANVDKLANEIGLDLDLSEFAEKVQKHKNAIEDTNILKYEPDMQALLRKLGRYESPIKSETTLGKIVNERGEPLLNETKLTKPTLQEANLLKGKLNQLANQHGASINPSDRHLAGVFGDLSRTLREDIQQGIKKSGHEGLRNAYKTAEENYANNFSPFLDKQVYKFINGNADPETLIQSFIKTGKSTDRANLISKITNKLPMEDRNLLGYAYLQRAMDENNVLNPLKLKTLLSKNSLGNKQFDALFPNPVIRNALRDYVELVDMNTKGLKLMQNPETGQMNMDILPLLGSPKSLVAKIGLAPGLGKILRSEKTRTKFVNKIVKKSRRK